MVKYNLILMCLLSLPLAVLAGGKHTHPYIPIENKVVLNQTTHVSNVDLSGVALGIAASQHHHDFATNSWQWSAGYGYYQSNDAFSVSIGKRAGEVLINGSVGRAGSETGVGVGLNGRF